ncbi:hypothetical protein [Microbacterium sp. DWRC1-3]|uniref:hypothetical protein n=1 Tax=Microbacterium sp. DWRC1-3 TaxID=2804630 RepID=UPI003CF1BD21
MYGITRQIRFLQRSWSRPANVGRYSGEAFLSFRRCVASLTPGSDDLTHDLDLPSLNRRPFATVPDTIDRILHLFGGVRVGASCDHAGQAS